MMIPAARLVSSVCGFLVAASRRRGAGPRVRHRSGARGGGRSHQKPGRRHRRDHRSGARPVVRMASRRRDGCPTVVSAVAAAAAVALVVLVIYSAGVAVELVAAGACAVMAAASVRVAFGRRFGSAGGNWYAAPAVQQPVLFINPRSGDGKAEKVGLADAARARAIRPVLLEPNDDLTARAPGRRRRC